MGIELRSHYRCDRCGTDSSDQTGWVKIWCVGTMGTVMLCPDCHTSFDDFMAKRATTVHPADALRVVADKMERARYWTWNNQERKFHGWKSAADFVRGEAQEYDHLGEPKQK